MWPDFLPDSIRNFLDIAMPRMQTDSRLDGVAAGGSFITGVMDAFSDLDLVIAVQESHYEQMIATKDEFIGQFGHPLSCFRGDHVGETRLHICIFEQDLLHVDFKFITTADFAQRVENPFILWERDNRLSRIMATTQARFPCPTKQWWEDRFWCWIYYVAQRLARGEYFEALEAISFLRNMVIGPMLHIHHGSQPRGMRFIERVAPEAMPLLKATVASYDALSIKNALRACMELYLQYRAPEKPGQLTYNQPMEHAVREFLNRIDIPG